MIHKNKINKNKYKINQLIQRNNQILQNQNMKVNKQQIMRCFILKEVLQNNFKNLKITMNKMITKALKKITH